MIWCLPCWVLVWVWSDLFLLCCHSSMLEWEQLIWVIVHQNWFVTLQKLTVKALSLVSEDLGLSGDAETVKAGVDS